FLLFGVFAGAVLMVLILGAQSYQSVEQSIESGYEARTCLQYIATKARHYSGEGSASVTTYGDGDALVLEETIDGFQYLTYIYTHNGHAMELFCEAGVTLEPDAGFVIVAVDDLDIQLVSDGLLHLSCTDDDGEAQLYLTLHTGEEGLK
ncbi:MAG: DUF4860 domain-containing protein, partial [Eubacteriales bacterium]